MGVSKLLGQGKGHRQLLAAGVVFVLDINKSFYARKLRNPIEFSLKLFATFAQNGTVQIGVFPPCYAL